MMQDTHNVELTYCNGEFKFCAFVHCKYCIVIEYHMHLVYEVEETCWLQACR